MNQVWFKAFLFFLVLLFNYSVFGQTTETTEEEWISLFNGKDLEGWNVKISGNDINIDTDHTFLVEEGVLKVYDKKRDNKVKIGHLFYKNPYSYYKLRFEYRFTGKQFRKPSWETQYGGVVFHAQSPQSMGIGQGYPVCLEFQLLGGLETGERSTGNVCTIGTLVEMKGEINPAHCIDSNSKTYEGNQWVNAEIVVLGDSLVTHIVEGDTVLQYEKPQVGGGFVNEEFDWAKGHVKNSEEWIQKEKTLLNNGLIGIQAHDPIEFRKVELLNLVGCKDPECVNYRPYHVQMGECSCLIRRK